MNIISHHSHQARQHLNVYYWPRSQAYPKIKDGAIALLALEPNDP